MQPSLIFQIGFRKSMTEALVAGLEVTCHSLQPLDIIYRIALTTPPSARSAAPFVAEDSSLAT